MSSNNKELEIALAAVKLFEQKGYRATSVQDIADEVGLQKGSLYHYIQSKEDLLLQIAHQAITEFNTRLEDVLSQPISAKEKLALMIESHLQVSIANLQTTTVLLRETFALGEKPHQVIQDLTDSYLELLTSILEEGRRNGEFHIEDCKITALAILGSCNWMYRWYNPSGKLGSTELAQIFTQIFLNGVQNDKSP